MKISLAFFLVSGLLITTASAQFNPIPNGGFEDWTGSPLAPENWTVLNFSIPLIGDFVSASKTTDRHSGAFAMKLESQSITLPAPLPALPPFSGSANSGFFPFDQRPTVLKGYYKYFPVNLDTASIRVVLTKWNSGTNQRDTIATGDKLFRYNVPSYTVFTDNLVYTSTESPDSASIDILSSPQATPQAGSKLYIDDLEFYPIYTGVDPIEDKSEPLSVFPNPAAQKITLDLSTWNSLKTIKIYDLSGREVLSEIARDHFVELNISQIPNGLYLCKVFQGTNGLLITKKINITR